MVKAYLSRNLSIRRLLPHPRDPDHQRTANVGEGVPNRLCHGETADSGNRDVKDHRVWTEGADCRQHFGVQSIGRPAPFRGASPLSALSSISGQIT
jgi:hypothetical protein